MPHDRELRTDDGKQKNMDVFPGLCSDERTEVTGVLGCMFENGFNHKLSHLLASLPSCSELIGNDF